MILYNKLVRDRIPEIIAANGQGCEVKTLDSETYVEHLNLKLGEELQEFLESNNIEELVDLMEVAYAIAAYHGIDSSKLDQLRIKKHDERGGFQKRLLLVKVSE